MTTFTDTQLTPATPGDWTELASRESNGLATSLFWSADTNEVKVVVIDLFDEAEFELDVDPAEALEAYHHPFAYASRSRAAAVKHQSLDPQPLS